MTNNANPFNPGLPEIVAALETIKAATGLTDEQIAVLEPLELTRAEHLRHPKAATVPKNSILSVNPSAYSLENLSKYSHKELKVLAQVIGANRSGSKKELISGVIKVWNLRKKLSAETVESLSKISKKEIDELLAQAGCGKYGNRRVKAATLLNWKNRLRDDAKKMVSDQNHIIRVRRAMEDGLYHQAILSSRMSYARATKIIESAALTVPEDLATPQNYKPMPKKVKAKQLLLPFMLE